MQLYALILPVYQKVFNVFDRQQDGFSNKARNIPTNLGKIQKQWVAYGSHLRSDVNIIYMD